MSPSGPGLVAGQRHGRLTILVAVPCQGKSLCLCDCGVTCEKRSSSILCGETRSCGCLSREMSLERFTKHGGSRTSEYKIWKGMKDRCGNENEPCFKVYGGRGIRVCDRWLDSFANFIADVGPRPSPKHSIDRIDNDGNYEPGNCRWATTTQQANNTSKTVRYEIPGRGVVTQQELAILVGVSGSTIAYHARRGDLQSWVTRRLAQEAA